LLSIRDVILLNPIMGFARRMAMGFWSIWKRLPIIINLLPIEDLLMFSITMDIHDFFCCCAALFRLVVKLITVILFDRCNVRHIDIVMSIFDLTSTGVRYYS
jgi:hypothetical protein